jgi:uncharacterized protein (TIGR03067 family)
MKTKLPLVLAAVALIAADEPKTDAVKDELKKFAGTWKLVAANEGRELKPEDVKTISLVVEGEQFTVKNNNEVVHKGKFVIDPSKKLKTIDVEFTAGALEGAKVKGIYRIDGDTLKSCFAGDRPTDFDADKHQFVHTWKADKPAETGKPKDKAGQPE